MEKIDIIIVNWNSGSQLQDCVSSIFEFGDNHVNQVIVVDNGSVDNSIGLLPKNEKKLKIILSKRNLGFAKACNIGAKESSAKYLLFFNPDAKLLEDTLDKVLKVMESEAFKEIGICGVKILDEHEIVQKDCARFPTWKTYVAKAFVLDRIFPSLFPSLWLTEFDHLRNMEVDHVMGCFFFIRSDLFTKLNGYDEHYFVYLEDLDLSLRAKKAGYKTLYFADAAIYHKGGGVSEQIKAGRLFYSLRSRIIYAFKHFSIHEAIVVFLCENIELIPRLARTLISFSLQEFVDTVKGYTMLWQDYANIMRLIRKILNSRALGKNK